MRLVLLLSMSIAAYAAPRQTLKADVVLLGDGEHEFKWTRQTVTFVLDEQKKEFRTESVVFFPKERGVATTCRVIFPRLQPTLDNYTRDISLLRPEGPGQINLTTLDRTKPIVFTFRYVTEGERDMYKLFFEAGSEAPIRTKIQPQSQPSITSSFTPMPEPPAATVPLAEPHSATWGVPVKNTEPALVSIPNTTIPNTTAVMNAGDSTKAVHSVSTAEIIVTVLNTHRLYLERSSLYPKYMDPKIDRYVKLLIQKFDRYQKEMGFAEAALKAQTEVVEQIVSDAFKGAQ